MLVVVGIAYSAYALLNSQLHSKAKAKKPFNLDEEAPIIIVTLWFIIAFLGLYGLPIKLLPFRYWMLLAIPLFGLYELGIAVMKIFLWRK